MNQTITHHDTHRCKQIRVSQNKIYENETKCIDKNEILDNNEALDWNEILDEPEETTESP